MEPLEELAKRLRVGYLKANHWEKLIPLKVETSWQKYLPMAREVRIIELEARLDTLQSIGYRGEPMWIADLTQAPIEIEVFAGVIIRKITELQAQLRELKGNK